VTVKELWGFGEKVFGNPDGQDCQVCVKIGEAIVPCQTVKLFQVALSDGSMAWAVVLSGDQPQEVTLA
jgi:hypothetical protein